MLRPAQISTLCSRNLPLIKRFGVREVKVKAVKENCFYGTMTLILLDLTTIKPSSCFDDFTILRKYKSLPNLQRLWKRE